ncbi:MAG: hypothetical protein JW821_10215 [Deltaproteobacteria bacterium]|nr:hypothetical protein [Deltaproteobacteria bacterium]
MKRKGKILLTVFVLLLVGAACLLGTIHYLVRHPALLKSSLEKTVSRSTGAVCSIGEISCSFKPLTLKARRISLRSPKPGKGLVLGIRGLQADLSLQGPFGSRTLLIERLLIEGLSLDISGDPDIGGIDVGQEGTSLFPRLIRGIIARFLFRDVGFQTARLDEGEVLGRFGDRRIELTDLRGTCNGDRGIELACKARICMPGPGIAFTAPHLLITTKGNLSLADPRVSFRVETRDAVFHGLDTEVLGIDLQAACMYTRDGDLLAIESLLLELGEVRTGWIPEGASPIAGLRLQTLGRLDLRKGVLNADTFLLTLPDRVIEAKGSFDAGFRDGLRAAVQIPEGRVVPMRAISLAPAAIRARLAPFRLSGPLPFRIDITARKTPEGWRLDTDLGVMFKDTPWGYEDSQVRAGGLATGSMEATGPFPDLSLSLKMETTGVELAAGDLHFGPIRGAFSLSGRHPAYSVKEMEIQAPSIKVPAPGKNLLVRDIRVRIPECRFDSRKPALHVPEIRLDTSLLKNLVMSFEMEGQRLCVGLQGEGTGCIEAALAQDLLPGEWRWSAKDRLRLEGRRDEGGRWTLGAGIEFRDLGFTNRDGDILGEKIAILGDMVALLEPDGHHCSGNLRLGIPSGEVLLDRIYLNLGKTPLSSEWEGAFDLSSRSVTLTGMSLTLKDLLPLHMQGVVALDPEGSGTHLNLKILEAALPSLFKTFLKEPFGREMPFLDSLSLDGSLSADLELRETGAHREISGRVAWREGSLAIKDQPFSAKGIVLDLPVFYRSGPGHKGQSPREGALSIRSLVLPLLPEQSLSLELEAGPNRLLVRSPTTLKVPGGRVRIGPMSWDKIFSGPELTTSLTLDDVDLEPILSGLWSRPLEGKAAGRLDPLTFRDHTLSSRGNITARVFGGEVLFREFHASGIFTSTPLARINAEWDGLHLAEMTRETSFGKVEGILRGHLKGLEIAYGQPQGFDLFLETVRKEGVPQKISVKAVDNIARIGGGQSPFIGVAGVFSSFFREFPYRKIGIHATLENDVFRINGTIREDGREYLIKRGGFSGVDVVNQSPDNRISFKDMIKRITRVTAPGSGPVIR